MTECCLYLWEIYTRFLQEILHSLKNVSFLFINPPSGRLISFGDAAAFTLVCLSLCFQPCIKMPGSAGYHGASSLLSAHFNPADFSSRFFISVCLFPAISLSLSLCPPIFISSLREDRLFLNNAVQGPRILFQFVATITKRRPFQTSIQHLDMIVSLNYKVYQHPWTGGRIGEEAWGVG